MYNHSLGAYANQARLYGTYRNEAGTLGGSIQLRASFWGSDNPNVTVNTFYGWFTMFDSKLKINVGKWTDSEFNEQQWWAGITSWGAARPGIAAYIYPVDGFRLGFGLQAFTDVSSFDDARFWVGAAYEGDSLGFYANASFCETTRGAAGTNGGTEVSISGYYGDWDPIIFIAYADLMRLDDYENKGELDFGEVFGFYGVENLDLELGAGQTIYGNGSDADLSVGLWIGYYVDVAGFKKLGIDFDFDISGKSLDISPYVVFGQSSSRNYLRLGYVGTIGFDDPSTFDSGIFLDFLWRF
jgi:hypothetical protein